MDRVSFQHVIVPLLRLVTQPHFAQSTLTELRNPVLATLNSQLPLDRVQRCITALVAARSVNASGKGPQVRSSSSRTSGNLKCMTTKSSPSVQASYYKLPYVTDHLPQHVSSHQSNQLCSKGTRLIHENLVFMEGGLLPDAIARDFSYESVLRIVIAGCHVCCSEAR